MDSGKKVQLSFSNYILTMTYYGLFSFVQAKHWKIFSKTPQLCCENLSRRNIKSDFSLENDFPNQTMLQQSKNIISPVWIQGKQEENRRSEFKLLCNAYLATSRYHRGDQPFYLTTISDRFLTRFLWTRFGCWTYKWAFNNSLHFYKYQ